MSTTTSNFSLIKPVKGDLNWGSDINSNWDTIDSTMFTNQSNIIVTSDGLTAATTALSVTNSSNITTNSANALGRASGSYTMTSSGNNAVQVIDNNGTGYGVQITQDGELASSRFGLILKSTVDQPNSELFQVQNDGTGTSETMVRFTNDGLNTTLEIVQVGALAGSEYGLHVYSNAAGNLSQLVRFHNDNAVSNSATCIMVQDGSGSVIDLAANNSGTHINFSGSPINIAPVNGDLWFDGSALHIRVAGSTKTIV